MTPDELGRVMQVPWPCGSCDFSGTAETVFIHLMSAHPENNRRVRTVVPNPNRRSTDTHSPVVAGWIAAGERGEGVTRRRIA